MYTNQPKSISSRDRKTENWILKVTPLTILFAHQSDTTLMVKSATTYDLSHITSNLSQFLNIEVKSSRVEPFVISIISADFRVRI